MKSTSNSLPVQPKVSLTFASLLVVTLPIEGTAALRNTLLLLTLITFVAHIWKHQSYLQLMFPLKWLWLGYAAIAIAGLNWAVDVPYSVSEIRHEIVISLIFFLLFYNLFRSPGAIRWLLGGLLVGNIFLVGYCLAIFLLGDSTVDGLNGSFHSGVGNFSTYMVTVIPLIVWLACQKLQENQYRSAVMIGLLLLCNLAAMYTTQNRQVFIAVTAELVIASFLFAPSLNNPRILILVLMLFSITLSLFSALMVKRGDAIHLTEATNVWLTLETDGRLPRWKFAAAESLQHPLTGAGLGRETFKHLYPDHQMTSSVFVHTHNVLINRLVQLGIPGALIFIMLLAGVPWLLWAKRNQSTDSYGFAAISITMCAGVLVKNMTDDFFVRELSYLYWLLGGAILGIQATSCSAIEVPKNIDHP